MDQLREKFDDIYLLRNEGYFKLYRFSDGAAIEPYFVLFVCRGGYPASKEIVGTAPSMHLAGQERKIAAKIQEAKHEIEELILEKNGNCD